MARGLGVDGHTASANALGNATVLIVASSACRAAHQPPDLQLVNG